jgi:curved DNA-binding protein CbpA
MFKKQNYYQIFGVDQGATVAEIKKAYHRLAREYHPDVNPTKEAAEIFKQITDIYKILIDPIGRREYDRELAKQSPNDIHIEIHEIKIKMTSQVNQALEFYQRGLKKSKKLKYQEAIADYTEAIDLNPQLVEAYYQRGFAQSQVSNNREAFADYTAALKLNANLPEIYYYRGLTRFKLANINGSLEDFNQALALKPDYGEAYYERGLVYQEMKDTKAAIADFNQALKVFERQGDRYNYRRTLKSLASIKKTLNLIHTIPSLVTLPLDTFKTWRRFGFNPSEGLFPAFINLDATRAIAICLGFSLIFNLCFVVGVSHWLSMYPVTQTSLVTLIIIGLLPIFSLTGASGLMRIIFQGNGSLTRDFFMATASLLPLGFWVLFAGFIHNWQAVVIVGIFSLSYTILTIYTGCNEMSQLSATQSALTVPIMLTLGVLPLMLLL